MLQITCKYKHCTDSYMHSYSNWQLAYKQLKENIKKQQTTNII
jgi:hypothetical protein